MNYVLGVDGGATKTVVQITDSKGKLLAESESGPSNYKSIGKESAMKNINKVIFDSINTIAEVGKIKFSSSCFGISGNDTENDLKIYKEIIFNQKLKKILNRSKIIICNDSRIGLEAGSNNKNRIMIICGTGSNCFGINEFGQEAFANGWDYILGDEGSGYSISLKALKAIMKAYDGRGESTILSKTILEYLNFDCELDLVQWIYNGVIKKENIAALSHIVCQTASLDDQISRKILKEEAEEAEITILAVVKKLGLTQKSFDIVLIGSVFDCRKYFKDVLINNLKLKLSKVNFKHLTKKPVEGAIKLAINNL